MSIGVYIIIGAVIALAVALIFGYVAWSAIAGRICTLETQIKDFQGLETDIAAQNAIIAIQTKAIEELQAEVARLDAEVVTWEVKFNILCEWVRTIAPDADVNGFLAQLEAGQ